MTGSRRKARILALQILFEIESVGHDFESTYSRQLQQTSIPDDAATYARELVQGVLQHRTEIDNLLAECAPSWPIEQMPNVDKNILRLAIYEILFDNRVPLKSSINEAIELAKLFGGENSPKFVNGVLGSVTARNKPDN